MSKKTTTKTVFDEHRIFFPDLRAQDILDAFKKESAMVSLLRELREQGRYQRMLPMEYYEARAKDKEDM